MLYLRQSSNQQSLEIEEIATDEKRREVGPGGDFHKQAWDSIDGLCFLILHTHLVRTTRRNLGSDIDVIRVPEKARPLLKTLWGSKHKPKLKWKETLFGEDDPFEEEHPYLATSGSDSPDAFEIWIPLDVEIKLLEADTQTEILTEHLRDLANRLTKCAPPKLSVEIKMDNFSISSSFCKGFLTRGHRIQIFVEWNFVSSLVVCWLNSSNELKALFPISSFKKLKEPFEYSAGNDWSKLSIPAYEELTINSPPGLETCLILSTKEVLPKVKQLESISFVKQTLSSRDKKRKISEPIFKSLPLGMQAQAPPQRVEMIEEPDPWERALTENLGVLFSKAYVFHVPNR